MGDPRKLKKKYNTPSHPWQGERIKEEKELMIKYGLKNKREVWKAQSYLRNLRAQARNLQAQIRTENPQAIKEADLLLKKCYRLGLLSEGAALVDVLAIEIETVLARRLQSLVYTKGLSSTPKQARQLIAHGHIVLGDRRVTIPGLLVPKGQERFVDYHSSSPFSFEEHPMRPKSTKTEEGMEIPSQVPEKIKIEVPAEGGGSS
ncbi:MAG TPA: 30S ribosomal protein S4 [Euryarchaeota archaeon]|nr:MAG: 30S ribosomal protein S4 [Thermoplasmatales archaeon ex4484_6]RLF66202.1 MAG: 30S ribosomal protein S4 [Thermoplasmata archaeon]HHD16748.1 30S ribosomal protein S4 [Euryarchaeota archaeon]